MSDNDNYDDSPCLKNLWQWDV